MKHFILTLIALAITSTAWATPHRITSSDDRIMTATQKAEYLAGQQIDFYDLYAEGDWFCVLYRDRITLFRGDERLTLAKPSCGGPEDSGRWIFQAILKHDL